MAKSLKTGIAYCDGLTPVHEVACTAFFNQKHHRTSTAPSTQKWRHPLKLSLMTFLDMLRDASTRNNSMLCVGLDPEPSKFPAAMRGDASKIYDFCAAIVDATHDLVNSFKPQIAYFAAHRAEDQLEKLMAHMRRVAPHVPVILDAKRGDIGSTAKKGQNK